MILKYLKI